MILSALMAITLGYSLPQEASIDALEAGSAAARPLGQELLLELSREPRIVGTRGYDRALDLVGSALTQAGLKPERRVRKSGRAIPLRSDLLLFEDGTSDEAFAGLRERWDPAAIPTMPRPMAFDHNPASAEVRGSVIHVGRGLSSDFERIAGLGVDLTGAVLLASMELAPAERATSVRDIAGRAAAAGAVGLMIAPALSDGAEVGPRQRTLAVEENTIGTDPLPLPTVPIRAIEAEAITGRLRTKRVRGADGKAIPLRLGPGPVEASIAVECPLVVLNKVTELVVTPATSTGTSPTTSRHISLVETCDRPLGGAFEVTAELLALLKGYDVEAHKLSSEVDPEHGASPASIEYVFGPFVVTKTPALFMPSNLASMSDPATAASMMDTSQHTAAIPGEFKHFDHVASQLGADLTSQLDAAARFLAYEGAAAYLVGEAPSVIPSEDPSWKAIAANAQAAAAALSRPR
jgi:hypothetical protein